MSDARQLMAGGDLGGTKIYSAVSTLDGEVLGDDRVPTEAEQGPEAVIGRIVESINRALAKARASVADLAVIGISSPGPIDVNEGIVTDAPNLPGWHNVPLAQRIREAFHVPTLLENDANAAAYGEYRFGNGRGYENIVLVTLGTGIGGGLILDGRLYRGASGAAGEVGHFTIDANAALCGCGQRGHLEALASGRAIAREAAAAIERGASEALARLAAGEEPTARHVGQAAAEGDPAARRIAERAGEYLGLGLASLLNIFNPDAIILTGGLRGLGDIYLGPARRLALEAAFPQAAGDATIVEGQLGDRAGALGAAALMIEERKA